MARTAKARRGQLNEEVDVGVFEDVRIRFPGDVYVLAVWLALSDRAKATPTCQPRTTLHGLARHFASLLSTDYSNPSNSEDVMAVFRRHGITGNPLLRLDTTCEHLLDLPTMVRAAARSAAPISGIAEQSPAPEPSAGSVSDGESSPPAQ